MLNKLLQQHEALKKLGLRVSETNLHSWIGIWDSMLDLLTETESTQLEEKLSLDIEKGIKFCELKDTKDDKGKKLYTDKTAQAEVDKEFYNQDLEQLKLKATIKAIKGKLGTIEQYINLSKLYMKK